jgi:hypothetical protein
MREKPATQAASPAKPINVYAVIRWVMSAQMRPRWMSRSRGERDAESREAAWAARRRATRWVGVSLGDGGMVWGWGGEGAGREACGAVGVKRVKVSEGLRDMAKREEAARGGRCSFEAGRG